MKLSKDEIYNLLIRFHKNNDKAAFDLLVISNMPLVSKFVKLNLSSGVAYEDLESAGFEGLIRGVRQFDYTRNIEAFSTYISEAIKNDIKREIKYHYRHNNTISIYTPIFEDNDLTIEDTFCNNEKPIDEVIITKINSKKIKELLSEFKEQDKKMIMLRYGLLDGKFRTHSEVSKIIGCSRAYVQFSEKRVLMKIRKSNLAYKFKEML